MKKQNTTNPFQALKDWDATFLHHHLPVWAIKKIRLWAIECGTWQAGLSTAHGLLPRELFDHWGSVLREDTRVLYTMPYGCPDALAEIWAGIMDCKLETIKPGPWHEMTTCYLFSPNPEN